MINGIIIKNLKILADDRGILTELLKQGEPTFAQIKQTTYTETYPGVIKAFHWHKKQTDIWFFSSGMAQVVLYDLRQDSSTYQETDVFYLGEKNPCLLLIPPGIAHGYRVLGHKPACLFYHATEIYDPANPDEQRIPFDSPEIGFDWLTKNR